MIRFESADIKMNPAGSLRPAGFVFIIVNAIFVSLLICLAEETIS